MSESESGPRKFSQVFFSVRKHRQNMELVGSKMEKGDVDLVPGGLQMNKIRKQSTEMVDKNNDGEDQMDTVLEETGQFGKYQILHLLLILVPAILSAPYEVNFIVTSATDDYR